MTNLRLGQVKQFFKIVEKLTILATHTMKILINSQIQHSRGHVLVQTITTFLYTYLSESQNHDTISSFKSTPIV